MPKGTSIVVNLRAINTYKAIWGEDALEWKPERWLKPLPKAVDAANIPGVYSQLYVHMLHTTRMWSQDSDHLVRSRMTFVGGARSCMYVLVSR